MKKRNYVQIFLTLARGEWAPLADRNVCLIDNRSKNVWNWPIDSTGAMLPVSAGRLTCRHLLLQPPSRWRKRSRLHETRRFFLAREEEPGRHGRLEIRRHARDLATLLVPHRPLGRGH